MTQSNQIQLDIELARLCVEKMNKVFLLKNLFTSPDGIEAAMTTLGLSLSGLILIIVSIFVLLIMDNLVTYEGEGDGSDVIIKKGAFIYVVWIIFIVWTLLLSNDMISTFIYFQF